MATSREEQLANLMDVASFALVADHELQWWGLVAELVLGVLFGANVVALNVMNVVDRYGWFSAVFPDATHPALQPGAPMDQVLLGDHPFSRRLALGPPEPVLSVTELVSLRQWRSLASYERMVELTGGAYHLTLHFDSPAQHQESLSIVRQARDFAPDELALAAQLRTVLQLGLTTVRQRLRLRSPSGWAPSDLQTASNAAQALGVTPRERLVLDLVGEGQDTRSIARALQVSPRTVYKHEQNVYRKLGVNDRVNALRAAREHLLLPVVPALPAR